MADAATKADAKATTPAVTEFPSGLTWVAGGTGVEGPLDPVTGVHAPGTPANEQPATVKVTVELDGSVHMKVGVGGAPLIPMGSIHIPQAQLADVIAAMQATPS